MAITYSSGSAEKVFSALDTQSLRSNAATTALNSGITLMQNQQYKEAAAAFRMSASYDPANTDAYNFMAQAYLADGDSTKAIAAYKLSLTVYKSKLSTATSSTTQDQVQINLANIYIQENRPVDAENALRDAIKTNPQNVVAPYTLGQLLLQQGRADDAEGFFRSAVRLSPRDGNAYYGLGLSLTQQGKTSDAIDTLNQAISLKTDFAKAIYELGNTYAADGQKDLAQAQIDALGAIGTDESSSYATILRAEIKQPKIVMIDKTSKSSFNTILGQTTLLAIDTEFIQAGTSKEVSVTFRFDSNMDTASVNNIANWSIGKARGASFNPSTGLYDSGLYRSTDTAVSPMPSRVFYDPTTQEATIFFSLTQNSSGDGTIDTSGIIFSFYGKDIYGKKMDPTADQIDGYAQNAF